MRQLARRRRSECVNKASCWKQKTTEAGESAGLDVQLLQETKVIGYLNVEIGQQIVSLPFGVAEIAGEVLWQQSQAAEGVVPPVVEIHYRPACGIQHPAH